MNKQSAYLAELNHAQQQAVVNTEGPVMIIAGAGSGKTRVLTYRIAYLMENGVDPFNILALTFTNKAAKEMRERIEKVVGSEARNLWMGTFHSVFARILRAEADKLGYPTNFTIYDTDDSKSLIKAIVKEFNLDDKVYKPGVILSRISSAKNNLITAAAYESASELTSYDASTGRPHISDIFKAYSERCFRAGAMDFDDILLNTYKLLNKFPDVLNRYQHRFRYLMVDEYQDTNHCQYMIIKRLAAVHENICVVGDDAQSIYSFRGANIRNILSFEQDYPDLKVFKLEQNYRSTKVIVEAAGSVISRNKEQLDKKVWTQNDEGEKINLMRAVTDNEEGKLIAQSIFEEKMKNQLHNSAFAILYRTNAQSRSLEEALRKQNIPYRIYGGTSFYQRKEIRDMIAYLRLIINPQDEEALKRIINYPTRGIGNTTLDRLILLANQFKCSVWDIIENAHAHAELKTAVKKLQNFATMMNSFRALAEQNNAYEVAMHVARQTTLLKTLNEDKTVEGISRYENLVELLNGVKEFVEDDESELEKSLSNYLQDIALLTDADRQDDDTDKVSLMTVHAAKGLEFPHVYITGLEENLFPSQMSLGDRSQLEEERRLFYVAITRAEKKLNLSFATSRFRFGTLLPCEASRFIEEIDPSYLKMDPRMLKSQSRSPLEQRNHGGNRSGLRWSGPQQRSSNSDSYKKSYTPQRPKPAAIPDFKPEAVSDLEVGQKIEHQRFGKGVVTAVEGLPENRKASVNFEQFGDKMLVLKFAKLRLIP